VVTTDAGQATKSLPSGIASVPDVSVIARLANEFFAALPGQPSNPASTVPAKTLMGGVDSSSIPFQPPGLSGVAPQSPDLASPRAAMAPPAVAGSPFYFLERESPAFSTSATAYPSVKELFTFSRLPDMSPQSTSSAFPSPTPTLTEAELGAVPATLTDATPLRPDAFASASTPAVPGASAYFLREADPSPLAVAPSFPGHSDIFSFPGVPGVQFVPEFRETPTSVPREADVQGNVPSSAVPAYSATQGKSDTAEPQLDSFEFKPELVPNIGLGKRLFDPHVIKRDFPILQEHVNGRPLVWLDNAATTQKPDAVINRISAFYRHENSNIHRAAHTLAARSTDAYEGARDKVRRFLNASSTREIVFVRGATEGINLVAKSWGHRNVQKDDEIVITWLEHHANIVPWQQLAAEKGARLRVAPVDGSGQVILEEYEKLLGARTRIVAFSQVSNALGTVTPAKTMIDMAHRHGARVLLDAAQSVAHMATDVQALDCDFLVFSGHKIFAPTGVGVVFGKADLLDNAPPWQGGGNMIVDVTFEKTLYNVAPARFEAGTGTIADAVGLGAALDYLDEIGMENISRYEHELLEYATGGLLSIPGLRLIGTAVEKAGVLSFVLDSMPPEEVGKALDQEGIAVRAGHHCAQPILRRFGVEKTVRPSLALYNTREDVDALVAALRRLQAGRSNRAL